MSTTSLIHHAFGVRGYRVRRTEYVGGEVQVTIEQPASRLRCSACRSPGVIRRGRRTRRFRGLPIGRRRVWFVFSVPRVECRHCGAVRQVEIPFAPGQHSYAKCFARYGVELRYRMATWVVAEHLGVSRNLVKELLKEALRRRFGQPRLKDLRILAIDEISMGGGHRYLTVVLDLETAAVVSIGQGKGAESLVPFWRRLRRSGARIRAVAIDLSQPYINAVRAHFPQAILVFDHFHVVKVSRRQIPGLPDVTLAPRVSVRARRPRCGNSRRAAAYLLRRRRDSRILEP